jgi:hypothetical protein
MDTDISDISTTGAKNHTQFDRLDLGLHTPYKQSIVPNLKKFKHDKEIGRIMQQQVRKVSVTMGNPFSIVIETPVTKFFQ